MARLAVTILETYRATTTMIVSELLPLQPVCFTVAAML